MYEKNGNDKGGKTKEVMGDKESRKVQEAEEKEEKDSETEEGTEEGSRRSKRKTPARPGAAHE